MSDHEFKAPERAGEPDEPAARMAEIRARAEAATDGPWRETVLGSEGYDVRAPDVIRGASRIPRARRVARCGQLDWDADKANAQFIAHARQDVPWLLAEVERLTGERDRARDREARLKEQVAAGEASDGHHTHRELYEYRMLYNAHAAHGWLAAGIPVVKSWTHSDGEPCFGGGWFIVAVTLPSGQVSNHYRAEHWGLFNIPEAAPPGYDGHTPEDAARRLRAALTEAGGE